MTKIEWAQDVWNPIVGCSVVSPGCTNCYAMRMAHRLAANPATPHYAGTGQPSKAGPVWTGKVALAPGTVLTAPLRRRKPTTYFVNSMGDLFHEDVPDDWIDRVFAVMALAPQHTFQVLTKRADRMRAYMIGERYSVVDAAVEITSNARGNIAGIVQRENMDKRGDWPLPNVWLGVSAEDQPRADERIPHLLATPAAVRFVSVEPMLGPVDLEPYVSSAWSTDHHEWPKLGNLDWVIVGGESGPGARPMHPHWARGLRDQCVAAAVPFFFKQWGAWICAGQQDETRLRTPPSGDEIKWLREDGLVSVRPISALTPGGLDDSDGETKIVGGEEVTVFPDHNWLPVSCVGKARAGNLLDGEVWQQFPPAPC